MSKHKPALPERLYYRLADAAQFLGCSADDLLHYGACGYLEICGAKPDIYAQQHSVTDEDQDGGPLYEPVMEWFKQQFIAITMNDLRKIELCGSISIGYCWKVYSFFKRATILLDRGNEPESDSFFKLSFGNPGQPNSKEESVFLASDLWVFADELRRFKTEGSSHVRSDPPMPDVQEKPIGQTERNKTLAIIAALCQEAGIDINAHGSVAAVARLTELLGAAVSADTVGRRLKEIPAALESFKT